MIRKIAIVVLVVLLVVEVGWQLLSSPAAAEGCTFERHPTATFFENHLQLRFDGHLSSGVIGEAKRIVFGMQPEDDGCGLVAEVTFEAPIEPGSFPIEGEASLDKWGVWTFKPSAGNHPKVKLANISAQASFGVLPVTTLAMSGMVTIDRASATELTGRLKLRGDGPSGGRVSYRFDARATGGGSSP